MDRRSFLETIAGGAGAALAPGAQATALDASPARTPVEIVPEPQQVPSREGYVEVAGAKLWYWDTGGPGQPIVLLHPSTGSAASWSYQQPVFAAAGYRVIAYSRRGHYRSQQSADSAPPRPTADLDDLRELARQLQLTRFHLLGSAAGSFLAAQYSVTFPETLDSVVLASSLLSIQEPEYQRTVARLLPTGFQALPAEFRELGPSYRALNPAGTERWIEIERASRTAPAGLAPAAAAPQGPNSGGAAPSSGTAVTFVALAKVASRLPMLLMTGEADLFMSPGLLASVAAHLPAAQLAFIQNAGHAAFWEQPKQFNQAVLAFLQRARLGS